MTDWKEQVKANVEKAEAEELEQNIDAVANGDYRSLAIKLHKLWQNAMGTKWQTIETAPKDSCQWILATEEACSRVDQVRWVPEGLEEGYNWVTLDGWFHPNKVFKYWMPLPEPPK